MRFTPTRRTGRTQLQCARTFSTSDSEWLADNLGLERRTLPRADSMPGRRVTRTQPRTPDSLNAKSFAGRPRPLRKPGLVAGVDAKGWIAYTSDESGRREADAQSQPEGSPPALQQ